ncbi:MAG: chemotaxis protein CheW [Rickettsiales bacterium]
MANSDKFQKLTKFVSVKLGSQYFGIPVEHVVDILSPQKTYPIPLAKKEILGSINLRGRIVTALDLKYLLGIKIISQNLKTQKCMVLELNGELFSFVVDEIGSVINFTLEALIKTPDTLSPLWQEISLGIFPIEEELAILLDINKTIESLKNSS